MGIFIYNRGAPNLEETRDPGGVRKYEIYINDSFIADFYFARSESLAECLRAAAKAVDETYSTKGE